MTDRDWDEFAVEYEHEGVDYLYECGEDGAEVRVLAEKLGGTVLTRHVFEIPRPTRQPTFNRLVPGSKPLPRALTPHCRGTPTAPTPGSDAARRP